MSQIKNDSILQLRRLTYWTRFSALPEIKSEESDNQSNKNSKFFSSENFTGIKKIFFTLCGVSKEDLEPVSNKESRNLSPEEEAQELSRFLKEDGKSRR